VREGVPMTRLLAFGTLALCVAAAVSAAAAQQPVFRGTSDTVRVFVTVTDHDGRLVTTLSKGDFEIRDQGKPQPIIQFDNTPQPIRLIVMLDVSGSMEGNLPLLRASASQLFMRLAPGDVARLGTFGEDITISPTFTHDPETLLASLPDSIKPDAPTPLWRGLDEAMDKFTEKDEASTGASDAGAESSDARPVILVLTDGKDSGLFTFRQKPVSQAEVIDRARRENVMIYAIGMRSRSRQPMPPVFGAGALGAMMMADLPDPGLARVAEETGGGYTEVDFHDDLGAAFAQVADELHSQYLLGYAPPQRDGKVHKIEVRLAKKGMKPRARKSYVAPRG
jgi:Ca-activated chloride channel homolog